MIRGREAMRETRVALPTGEVREQPPLRWRRQSGWSLKGATLVASTALAWLGREPPSRPTRRVQLGGRVLQPPPQPPAAPAEGATTRTKNRIAPRAQVESVKVRIQRAER